MVKVAILDDYQNVAQDFVDLKKLSGKYEIEIFNEWFENEEEAIEKLNDFEALIIMRERTKISENLIKNLKKLKYISTSGMRNKAIDLEAANKKKIIVTGGCGFIGSNFLKIMVSKYKKINFLNIDSLTYAGKSENVKDLKKKKNFFQVMF